MEKTNEKATKMGFLEWLVKIKNVHYFDYNALARALQKID